MKIIGINNLTDMTFDGILQSRGVEFTSRELGKVGASCVTRYDYSVDGAARVAYESSSMIDCDCTTATVIVCDGPLETEEVMSDDEDSVITTDIDVGSNIDNCDSSPTRYTPFVNSDGEIWLKADGDMDDILLEDIFYFSDQDIAERWSWINVDALLEAADVLERGGDASSASFIRSWVNRFHEATTVIGKVFVIKTCKPGRDWTDCTFSAAMTDCFRSRADALKALADWVEARFFDWLQMDDDDGAEKAVKRIMEGYSFEDGNGVLYSVYEEDFEQHFDCGPDGTNDHRDFRII